MDNQMTIDEFTPTIIKNEYSSLNKYGQSNDN